MIDVGVEIQKVRKRLGFTKLDVESYILLGRLAVNTKRAESIEGEEFVHYQRSNRDCLAVF